MHNTVRDRADNVEMLAYPIPELCRRTGFGRSTIYREIAAGRLRVMKKGGRVYVLAEDARAWLRGEPAPSADQGQPPESERPTADQAAPNPIASPHTPVER